MPRVAIIVPTLGKRTDFLEQALRSIRAAGDAYIAIIAPQGVQLETLQAAGLCDQVVIETGRGLAAAINQAESALPDDIPYFNWLGDDDLLSPKSIALTSDFLDSHAEAVAAYGGCDYIDKQNRLLWTNRSGKFAAKILNFGPDLIPQPGALIRRSAFREIGGLDTSLGLAFDFDMFIKLKSVGKLTYLPVTLASFRWHSDSLSVATRRQSVREASRVRVRGLPAALRPLAFIWEIPVQAATYWAGSIPSKRAAKARKSERTQ